jgi:hypothetical protein
MMMAFENNLFLFAELGRGVGVVTGGGIGFVFAGEEGAVVSQPEMCRVCN